MTKITNITYRGIKHTPSNISDKDGSALECVNLTQDGTDLKPMPMPAIQYDADGNLIHFPKNTTLVAVHEVTGERHYILTSPNANGKPVTLYFKDQDNLDVYTQPSWTNGSEIYAVESIGNTLVVSTANGIEYFYWKNGAYVYLGQKPPMPVLQFKNNYSGEGSVSYDLPVLFTVVDKDQWVETGAYENITGVRLVTNDDGHTLVPYISPSGDNGYTSDKARENSIQKLNDTFYENVISKINAARKKIYKGGQYYAPYFVRYAIRLKDGNYIQHSAPIFMNVDEKTSCILSPISGSEFSDFEVKAKVNCCSLVFSFEGYDLSGTGNPNATMDDWADIVTSVDVFVSEQMPSFDINELKDDGRNIRATSIEGTSDYEVAIPGRNDEELFVKISELSTFHRIYSIDFQKLENSVGNVFIETDTSNLHNFPTLPDDYNSHCSISPKVMSSYNQRLNIANLSQRAFSGYDFKMYFDYGDPQQATDCDFYFHLYKNGTEIVVKKSSGNYLINELPDYIYYPDPDCFKVTISRDGGSIVYSFDMKKCYALNGSYVFLEETVLQPAQIPTVTDAWYSLPNRFAMSAVGNPWYFPVANMFDIGKREIRSLSINAEELSYAQYGQNPILVLASDGTWSLGIQGDGSPKGVSYISSDVISKMETLTDTPSVTANQATFFVTDRGLMMASGSKVIEVGRDMHGAIFDCKNELLPQNSVLPTPIHVAFNEIINKVTDNIPFADYIKGANLAWDYKHNRLLVINKAYPYVYVYDLSFDFWSKMLITDTMLPIAEGYQHNTKSTVKFTQCVNNGTELFMQDNNGYLYDIKGDIDENDIDELQYGFYVSRPMRFGADTFKTIVRLKHRFTKNANGENVKMMLYGSRDGNTFYRISTMRGSAYMYFIVVLYTTLLPAQRYAYTSFEFEDRLTNKLR